MAKERAEGCSKRRTQAILNHFTPFKVPEIREKVRNTSELGI
jgi:hypothetical protein